MLQWQGTLGVPLVSGAMNNVFPDVQVGAAATVAWVRLANVSPGGPMTTVRAWLAVDATGVTVNLAVGAGPGSTPTFGTVPTGAAPLTVADIPAESYVWVAIRRDPASGSPAWPERNVLVATANGPI